MNTSVTIGGSFGPVSSTSFAPNSSGQPYCDFSGYSWPDGNGTNIIPTPAQGPGPEQAAKDALKALDRETRDRVIAEVSRVRVRRPRFRDRMAAVEV